MKKLLFKNTLNALVALYYPGDLNIYILDDRSIEATCLHPHL